jgi:hypothetical protein
MRQDAKNFGRPFRYHAPQLTGLHPINVHDSSDWAKAISTVNSIATSRAWTNGRTMKATEQRKKMTKPRRCRNSRLWKRHIAPSSRLKSDVR